MNFSLSVNKLTKNFGRFTAVDNISFDVKNGEFFSILGPSGCGKTTLLRMVAGFHSPSSGSIRIQGKSMDGVEPNKRPVNLVFQHLALFPMMNVFDNVAFGLKRRGEPKKQITQKVYAMLERVGLPNAAQLDITRLSGGQQQRVAIARCLVLDPSVLLLDEPLGALDAKLREHMKVELKKLQAKVGTTFIYITHDQSEAMVMSDHVAVMKEGRFEQVDTPQNLYNKPASAFVARFVGENNPFEVSLAKDSKNRWTARAAASKSAYLLPDTFRPDENKAMGSWDMFVRPEAIMIQPDNVGSQLNILKASVKAILFDGGNSRLLVSPEQTDQELIVALPQNRQYDHIQKGDAITIGWDPNASMCFHRKG